MIAAQCFGAATVHIEGATKKVLTEQPTAASGLNAIYIVPSTMGLKVSVTPSSGKPSQVVWKTYDTRGGGFAEETPSYVEGDRSVLTTVKGDCGYIVEDGTDPTYFWIVDYSQNALDLNALSVGSESDCQFTQLILSGNAEPIEYYSINGRLMTLSRDLSLSYNTLTFNEEAFTYSQTQTTETIEAATSGHIRVPAPLCATSFTLSGDRFLKEWGEQEGISTPADYDPIAVEAHSKATRLDPPADNQSGGSSEGLGGSAPANIRFEAAVSDAAIFHEWQFSTYADFEDITDRYSELSIDYTFDTVGSYYVRFACANYDGTCDYICDTYEITIGDSSLKCPNVFSPGTSEGVNDVWKVSYKSIIKFECHIFNRWGKKMTSFTNPADGWDGTYNGKLVPTGVYYYVIKAEGADGKKYDLSGDINILRYK